MRHIETQETLESTQPDSSQESNDFQEIPESQDSFLDVFEELERDDTMPFGEEEE